jgi:hypothetical protein
MKTIRTEFKQDNPGILILGGMQYEVGKLDKDYLLYDFPQICRFLNARGKLLFGKQFKIHKEDYSLILKLTSYFIDDMVSCQKYGLDLNKGILLSGPVGCGKTSLMRLMPHLVPHKKYHQYTVMPTRNIVFGFNNLGYKTIEDYTDRKPYCFDDLGVEPIGRHYGKDCNVMGEILISRYEFPRRRESFHPLRDGLTHITTNLNAQELENRYGERVRSRMREMFNLISFNRNSKDKRS